MPAAWVDTNLDRLPNNKDASPLGTLCKGDAVDVFLHDWDSQTLAEHFARQPVSRPALCGTPAERRRNTRTGTGTYK